MLPKRILAPKFAVALRTGPAGRFALDQVMKLVGKMLRQGVFAEEVSVAVAAMKMGGMVFVIVGAEINVSTEEAVAFPTVAMAGRGLMRAKMLVVRE